MRVLPAIRKCVVFLGCQKDGRLEWAATGFFIAVKLNTREERWYSYLVTARHVIDMAREQSGDGKLHVRLNLQSDGTKQIETKLEDWRFHPTKEVDVAALPFSERWFDDMDHMTIREDAIADEALVERRAVGPGDDVFMTGLFVNHLGKRRNIPIMRVGNISAMPEEPLRMRLDSRTVIDADAYLIESRSIGGLSGSPVFVYFEDLNPPLPLRSSSELQVTATTSYLPQLNEIRIEGTIPDFYLLGLVHGHWDVKDPIADSEDMASEVRRSVNVGIAIVVPATVVRETLDHPEFVEHREQLAKVMDDEDSPTPDLDNPLATATAPALSRNEPRPED